MRTPRSTGGLDLLWNQIETGRLDAAAGTAARLLLEATAARERAGIESAVGVMLLRVGRTAEARERLRAAAALATDDGERCTYLARLAAAEFVIGDLAGARATSVEACRLAERGHDPSVGAEALAQLALVTQAEGDPAAALALAHRARAAGSRRATADGASVAAIAQASALVDLDRLVDAERVLTEALEWHVKAGVRSVQPWLLGLRGVVRLVAGEWDAAVRDAHECLAVGEQTGVLISRPWGWGVAAVVDALRGNAAGAHRTLADAGVHRLGFFGSYGEEWLLFAHAMSTRDHATYRGLLGDAWFRTRIHPWMITWRSVGPALVRAALAGSETELAGQVSDAVAEGARLCGQAPSAYAASAQCRGLLDSDPALLDAAAEAFRVAGRPFSQGLASMDAARIWLRSGRPGEAIGPLRDATAIFHDLHAMEPLAMASSLLARCAGVPVPAPRRPDPLELLTRAERRVALHAGRGMTNPQIAAELSLSARTVQAHLSNVYAKLSIGSRVQLAAMVAGGPDGEPR